MSKAIIILDEMPENCEDCSFFDEIRDPFGTHDGEPTCNAPIGRHIWYSELKKFESKQRPDFCPLHPMPQKQKFHKRYRETDVADEHFIFGWNQCIEALTRKQ